MKVYQGYAASSGLVLGQVSRVERRTESFGMAGGKERKPC